MQYFRQLLANIFLGGNVVIVLFLWLCCAFSWVSPVALPQCAVLTLAFPFFLFANLAFVFLWIIFKARYVFVPLVGFLVVGGYVMDYCPLQCREDVPEDSSLLVVSYNVGSVISEAQQTELIQYIKGMDADILCLQEAEPSLLSRRQFKESLDSIGYKKLQLGSRCVYSRLPFIGDSIPLHYPTNKGNGSLACYLKNGEDTLLVINNHLESYGLSDEEKSGYKNAIKHPNSKESSETGLMLFRKMKEVARCRGGQVDSICAFIDAHAGKSMIVCGDFNDTPISYAYQQISKRLDCAWREGGQGVGLSYNQIGFFVRIDHLFYSSDWVCPYARIDNEIELSDHYPLFTYLRKNPN